jgi:transposase-like protein
MYSFVCPKCKASDIVKRGKRHNKLETKQLYRCNECRSTFVEPDGFERMRYKKEDIVRAVHMHSDGMSLFKTQYHLWQHDAVKVTRKTISDWTKKYGTFLKSASSRSRTKA